MRYVGLVLVVALIPILIAWLKANPHQRKWAYAAIGVLPFTINAINLDAAFIVWPTWPGYAKGLTFTALDSLALAIIFSTPGAFRKLPFLLLLSLYLFAALISVGFSSSMMSSSFYVFQLARVLAIFVAVASIVTRPDGLRWLAMGLAAGALFQAGMAIDQRLSGAIQSAGTMGHQNLLGMMLHFVTLPLLAMLLAGMRSKLVYAGVAAALIAVALGASRGSIGFAAIGAALVFLFSLARGFTAQKGKIIGFGVLVLAVTGPLMIDSLDRRFEAKPVQDSGDYDERAAFEEAATMMWGDHPMGVGANQYVVSVNALGYNNRAGITWAWASRSANVHNLYLLAGAETGYLGLFAIIALFAGPIWIGMRYAFSMRKDPRGDVVLGFTLAILVTAIHSFFEWIFVTYQAQYMFAIALGVIAGYVRDQRAPRAARTAQRTAGTTVSRSDPQPARSVPEAATGAD